MSLHPLVQGFADVAEEYELGRPGYVPEAIEAIRTALGLAAGARVADVGAGTGKLTRALLAAGLTVIAVEPLPSLRATLARTVPEADIRAGTAEALPLADGEVDAVICADAYHWFDGPRAVAEFARVIAPGRGGVALLWNWEGDWEEAPPWRAELHAFIESIRPEHPSFTTTDQGRGAVDASPAFEDLTLTEVHHELRTDPARLLAQITSMSFVGGMPEPERGAVLAHVEGILARHDVREFMAPLRTAIWTAPRRPSR
jgi:SAM-dependent methyltransferase